MSYSVVNRIRREKAAEGSFEPGIRTQISEFVEVHALFVCESSLEWWYCVICAKIDDDRVENII
jgi:hypothetical protein